MVHLASAFLRRAPLPSPPSLLTPPETFISLVYILTNRLVSHKCYFLLKRKMKRRNHTQQTYSDIKSMKKDKACASSKVK